MGSLGDISTSSAESHRTQSMPPTQRLSFSKPRLLDEIRAVARMRHLSLRTEQAYLNWIKRYVFFHHKRHPREMGEAEIREFISHLAMHEAISASTQTVALSALLFLYRD